MASMNLAVKTKGIKQGTNILEVNIPAKLRERHKIGISWVEDALGGEGCVPSSVTMITGGPGAGKSTLIRQMADAITGAGHICIMNSGEESPYQIAMSCERLKLKNGFLIGQETMIQNLLTWADNVMKANPKKQVFLLQDSLQTLDDGHYKDGAITSGTTKNVTELFTGWAKRTYGIGMFVCQVNKDGSFSGKNTIKHAVDGHAELAFDEEKKSETFGERLFHVSKNRWGCNGRTYIVGMGDKGLYEKGSFDFTKTS